MNSKKNLANYLFSAVGVIAMLLIVMAIYFITSLCNQHVDLTADHLYTLSRGTRAILGEVDTPVQIRFYYSRSSSSMPVLLKTYAQRIEDLLQEYRKASKGKIQVTESDPQPDSDAEDSANLDGVEGQMVNTGDKIYLGLSVNCLDTKSTLPFLTPDRDKLLEYDLSRAISEAIRPTKPVIGIMSALSVFGEFNPMMMQMGRMGRQEPWALVSELKRAYTVKQVEMTADKIDDDVKVLLVIYPRGITDKTEYALDQFVLRGGKLIAFLDPLSIADPGRNPNNPLQQTLDSGASLDKLLKAWSIEFDKSKVIADTRFTTHINRGGREEATPAVLTLTRQGVDTNDVVTSQIDNMILPFAGVFSGTPAAGLKETVLLKTTPESQQVEKIMAQFSGEQIVKDFAASGKSQAIAIRLTGKFKTAFPEGKPKETTDNKTPETKDTTPSLKESKGEGVVVLVGDCDMLLDTPPVGAQVQNFFGQRLIQHLNQNFDFAENLVDQMSGDDNLIGLRSRATMKRPFEVVKQMQDEANQRYQSKIKELEKRLSDAQQKINELQSKKEGNQRFILSPEQQAEIARFQQERAKVNKDLKEVRKNLRQDIDWMETKIKWTNILLMPLLVCVSGITLAIYKRKQTAAK